MSDLRFENVRTHMAILDNIREGGIDDKRDITVLTHPLGPLHHAVLVGILQSEEVTPPQPGGEP